MKYICTCCGVEKSHAEYYVDKRNIHKRVVGKCKECCKKFQKTYKAKVGYLTSDRERALRWRHNNLEHCREQERQRYIKNPASYKRASDKWRAVNGVVASAKYNATKKRAMPKWADAEKIRAVYQNAKTMGLHVDHIVPLQSAIVCGLHVWRNLQLLDKGLNSAKSNREWPDMPVSQVAKL